MIINLLLASAFAVGLIQTALFGGLLKSGLVVVYGLIFVLAALIAFGIRAASWWFAAFVASVVYATMIPNWIDPVYVRPDSAAAAAFNLIATGIVTYAVVIYFVRQRDRFQKQSDDLLHNILPDEIASRLKASTTMIADSFESASVLFADVVDFTPMSAGMSPGELVTLLDRVFTTFDGLVEELGFRRRSRRLAMPTWSRPACLKRGKTTPRRSPSWRCESATTVQPMNSRVIRSPCGSVSTRARSSLESSGVISSPTTCGAMSST